MNKIFILVDAMRSDYISEKNTPFLHSLSKNYYYIKNIKPSLGFCERSEIISGQRSEKSGYFTAIGKNINKSDYRNLPHSFSKLIEYINFYFRKIPIITLFNKNLNFSKALKKILNKYLRKKYKTNMPIYNIPLTQLMNFFLTEDEYDHFSKDFFKESNLVQKVKKKGMKINNDAWTFLGNPNQMSDKEVMKFLIRKSVNNNEFIFAYLGILDIVGHKYGPKSKEMYESLSKLDTFFEELITANKDNDVVILGDHGMKTIEKFFDISDELSLIKNKFDLKLNDNFNFFIDSTMLRLWVKKDIAPKIINYINSNKLFNAHGKIINQKISEEIYGNVIWIANEGVMLYPDFFHFNKPVGMHGYSNSLSKSQGTAIIYKKNLENTFIKSERLSSINNIIMDKLF